jgi:signal transduction histidine kinase
MTSPTALPSTVVRQMADAFSASISTKDRTERLVAVLQNSIDFHAAVVYQRRPASGEAPVIYPCGISPELAQHMADRRLDPACVAGIESFINGVAVAGKPRLSDLRGTVYHTLGRLVWSASFPVFCGPDFVGVLIVAWRDHRELRSDQVELCETAAALIGVALSQDALVERETERAIRRERARLARDIHDSATQAVTASVLHLEAADRALDTDPAAAHRALVVAKQLARDTLADLRRSIWDLRSSLLQERSFGDAIEKIAQRLRSAGIACAVGVRGATSDIPANTGEAAISIAREAANNTLRHSGAKSAEIMLVVTQSSVVVSVTDDGGGMAEHVSDACFGLVGMEERAHSVGGSLRVSSCPGNGTRVEAYLPYGSVTD